MLQITGDNFKRETAGGVCLIDFWAPWCGPCRMLAPVLERVAARLNDRVKIGKCNVDEEPTLAAQFEVRSIPTLVIVKDGREVDRLVGLQSEDSIVQRVLKNAPPPKKA